MILRAEHSSETLNSREEFERKLLHVGVAFEQMRKYQHEKYFDVIEDGSEQGIDDNDMYWVNLSSRVDHLKILIERDSVIKRAVPEQEPVEAAEHSDPFKSNTPPDTSRYGLSVA